MLIFLLFCVTCLLSITRTRQFQLDEYMQMIYNQPTAYQHLLTTAYQAYPARSTSATAAAYQRYLQHAQAHPHPHHQQQQPTHDHDYPVLKPQVLTRLHRNVHGRQTSHHPHRHRHHQHQLDNGLNNKLLNLKLDGEGSSQSTGASSLNSMMRNLILAESYSSGLAPPPPPSGTMAAVAAAANESPAAAAMIGANLIDSLDTDDIGSLNGLGSGAGGHFDPYPYHGRDQAQFTVSPISNNNHNSSTLALYRLLNLIDQSVPSSISTQLPIQNPSKSSPLNPMLGSGAGLHMPPPATSPTSFNNNNNNNKSSSNSSPSRHQTLTSQTSPSSMPNHWSRKRNQMYWRQQQAAAAAAANQQQQNQQSTDSSGAKQQSLFPNQPPLVDPGKSGVQPSTMKMIKSPSSASLSSNSKVPHDADSEMIAANNAPRCDKFTPDICVDDFEYPEQAIIDEIQKKRDVFELMYSEVKDNEPLVDGIPRDVEESYNYDYYYYGKTNMSSAASQNSPSTSGSDSGSGSASASASGPSSGFGSGSGSAQSGASGAIAAGLRLTPPMTAYLSKNQRSSSPLYGLSGGVELGGGAIGNNNNNNNNNNMDFDGPLAARASSMAASSIDGMDALIGATPQASNPSTSAQSPPTTGFICPSEVMYGKPKLAKNRKGLWKVIVNAGEFTQTVRLEKCLSPNKKCNYVSALNYESRCAQVHSYHRLLVFEKGRGFYIDTFRLPTGCNCHVTRRPLAPAPAAERKSPGSSSSPSSPPGRSRILAGNERNSSESMLSQTLWSILSGGGGSGTGSGNGSGNGLTNNGKNYQIGPDTAPELAQQWDTRQPVQRAEAYHSQSLILDHLSQNPGLAANISDSVLRQLIDVGAGQR